MKIVYARPWHNAKLLGHTKSTRIIQYNMSSRLIYLASNNTTPTNNKYKLNETQCLPRWADQSMTKHDSTELYDLHPE